MQIRKPVKFQSASRMNFKIESKIEIGIEFQFEYFILHLKSGLFKQIMKSILQKSTSNI